jgi:hypothetical protein
MLDGVELRENASTTESFEARGNVLPTPAQRTRHIVRYSSSVRAARMRTEHNADDGGAVAGHNHLRTEAMAEAELAG